MSAIQKIKNPKQRYGNLAACLMLLFVLSGCGGAGAGNTGKALGGGFFQGEVRPLSFDNDGEANMVFGDLSGNEEFALFFFSANTKQGNFNIQLQSTSQEPSQAKFLQAPSPYLGEEGGEEDLTSSFHQLLREEEKFLAQIYTEDRYGNKALSAEALVEPSLNSAKTSCADGDGILINVLNSLSNIDSYQATCGIEKRITANAIYYVDQEVEPSLSNSQLNNIINDFESKIPLEREILGNESDVDGNGKFCVYFTPGVNRLGLSAGGFVTGYFFGGDLFSRESMPSSNEMECLFISVPDPTGRWGTTLDAGFWESNIAPTVLPHEYQHMISFRYKVLVNEVGAEEAWANEGISHLMEDLEPGDVLRFVSEENPSRVGIYLNSTQTAAFTAGTSLAQRGGAYLFFRYLCEQAELNRYPGLSSCRQLLEDLVQSSRKGVANVEDATGWPLRNLLLDFYAALQLSDTGLSSDPRYNFSGIDLYGPQNDNRGTVLEGVRAQNLSTIPASGSVSSPGGIFFNSSGNTIKNAGNNLTFSSNPGMLPGGAIIRLQ